MNRLALGAFLERLMTPQILWSVFLVTTSLFIMATIILWYHWRTYALQTQTMRNARIVYVAGSVVFVILQFTALLSL